MNLFEAHLHNLNITLKNLLVDKTVCGCKHPTLDYACTLTNNHPSNIHEAEGLNHVVLAQWERHVESVV